MFKFSAMEYYLQRLGRDGDGIIRYVRVISIQLTASVLRRVSASPAADCSCSTSSLASSLPRAAAASPATALSKAAFKTCSAAALARRADSASALDA
jgi:hypothetical protein